jgi:MFS family permease
LLGQVTITNESASGWQVADRLGRRRLFTTGLLSFSIGSLLCSLAPDTGSLVALRMLQALGGSMLVPVSLSIVRNLFTDARERAQASARA